MHGVQAKKVVGYMVMPGILPRAQRLFASGFGYLAFLMANVYNMVRLLPPNHPYLNPANIGKFGIRHVIAEAANNLVVDRKNIDQLFIFSALLISIVLLLVQIILLVWSVVFQPAMAYSMFTITTPFNDLAYMLLDSVFGVPNMFNSCVALSGVCPNALAPSPAFPTPFHTALHSLFQYYSTGMLLIGVLIFLYFMVVVVVETAVSGAPFGQRFASVWAPIRLVVAIGLLIPFNYGLNSGQYLTLYAAKFGSNLASNGWIAFNEGVAAKSAGSGGGFANANNPLGEHASLVALPKQQDASVPVQFMSLVHECAYIYNLRTPDLGGIGASWGPLQYVNDPNAPVKPYLVKFNHAFLRDTRPYMPVDAATTHVQALDFYDNGDIIIRFGVRDPVLYKDEMGGVYPTCGDIRLKVTDVSEKGQGGTVGGPDYILESYFNLVKQMWFNDTRLRDFGMRVAGVNMQSAAQYACAVGCGAADRLPSCTAVAPATNADCQFLMPASDWKQDVTNGYQTQFNYFTNIAWYNYATSGADFAIQAQIIERGWAGAGMWYNRIAQVNGAFITAVLNTPTIDAYPKVMEDIRSENRKNNAKITLLDQFRPNLTGEKPTQIDGGEEALQIGIALNAAYEYWNYGGANMADPEKIIKGNIFTDAINMLLGTGGLFDMRNENLHTHPMAQLVGLGKGLVEATIRNMTTASVSAFLGGMGAAMEMHTVGALGAAAGQFFSSFAFIGLTAGVVLYYVLPFLPFVYFYFAVGSWLKTIFEAMVGVPLWALAHLRIDGQGLPGDSALNGYFLIFDIFVRPILTVFGLIASVTIFTAQVRILNIIWDMVTNNVAGFNDTPNFYTVLGPVQFKRAEIDQFFFTIIYAMVVYMLATASFKLIDKIPDGILRWMGSGVSTFSDINQDPTESMTKYAALGGVSVSQQLSGTASQTAGQLGKMLGGK